MIKLIDFDMQLLEDVNDSNHVLLQLFGNVDLPWVCNHERSKNKHPNWCENVRPVSHIVVAVVVAVGIDNNAVMYWVLV